jgi:hypothetical protein
MTSENTVDLAIPPAAVDAYFVCGCSESGIRAGYKPEALDAVVAAELRRLAEERWNRNLIAPADLRDWLRARADELDPGSPAATRED